MLLRNCAGGVVFNQDKVFILKNDKGEWVLPKGIIREGDLATEVATQRVKEEGGVDAEIISTAGNTSYEFYSMTRQKPVCNKITWYIMKSDNDGFEINEQENFTDGGFYNIDEAMEKITYSQDKSLVSLSYKKFKEF
jgi:predicted NUDIX family NTP pyrophosphohydrolase